MLADTEATDLKLPWVMQERGERLFSFERSAFVNLKDLHGKVQIDFELIARFLNNRRTELPVWVRTNSIELN